VDDAEYAAWVWVWVADEAEAILSITRGPQHALCESIRHVRASWSHGGALPAEFPSHITLELERMPLKRRREQP
jgi:hypothetical protein